MPTRTGGPLDELIGFEFEFLPLENSMVCPISALSGSPCLPEKCDQDAHILEKRPGVNVSNLDSGDSAGRARPLKRQVTERNPLIQLQPMMEPPRDIHIHVEVTELQPDEHIDGPRQAITAPAEDNVLLVSTMATAALLLTVPAKAVRDSAPAAPRALITGLLPNHPDLNPAQSVFHLPSQSGLPLPTPVAVSHCALCRLSLQDAD